jgi:hypothetical protein
MNHALEKKKWKGKKKQETLKLKKNKKSKFYLTKIPIEISKTTISENGKIWIPLRKIKNKVKRAQMNEKKQNELNELKMQKKLEMENSCKRNVKNHLM